MTRREWQILNNRHSHTCVCCGSVHGGNHYHTCTFATEDHTEGPCFDCWQVIKNEISIAIPGASVDRELIFDSRPEPSLEVLQGYLVARAAQAPTEYARDHWLGRLDIVTGQLCAIRRDQEEGVTPHV